MGMTIRIRDYVKRDPERVLRDIRIATAKGHPCIVCVHGQDEGYFHWMCVASVVGQWAVVLDPAMTDWWLPERTFWTADRSHSLTPSLMRVSRLLQWIDPGDELAEKVLEQYGTSHQVLEVAVAPGQGHRYVRGTITEETVRAMRRDLTMASDFDQVIQDLKETFSFSCSRAPAGAVPAGRFLRRNAERLTKLVTERVVNSACDARSVREQIRRLVRVASGYAFYVRRGDEPKVLAALAFHLGWHSCSVAYGIEEGAA
ncbi:MAG: hypothetical protein HY901_07910 [Deltaproteobacteria bacterium]|nr:hypothetical protein [Deltaproteobacteria bacterium]